MQMLFFTELFANFFESMYILCMQRWEMILKFFGEKNQFYVIWKMFWKAEGGPPKWNSVYFYSVRQHIGQNGLNPIIDY